MVALLREFPQTLDLITRRYPVDLPQLRKRLDQDLSSDFDAIIHLGQSPGSASIKLESFALNVAGCIEERNKELPPLSPSGPAAFRTSMPLKRWKNKLTEAGVPSIVSYHAGTFLCNATMYLTHEWLHERGLNIPTGFIHLPLATEQVANAERNVASLPAETLASALRVILEDIGENALASPTNSSRQLA